MSVPVYDLLSRPVSCIPGIGPALEKKLQARAVECLGDLLLHLPKGYLDDRRVTPLVSLQPGVEARVQGKVVRRQAHGHGRRRQVNITLADDSGSIVLLFFHSGYMMSDARLGEGQQISVRGVPERRAGGWQMLHPDWLPAGRFSPGYRPLYGSLAGLGGKRVGGLIGRALSLLPADAVSPLDGVVRQAMADIPTLAAALHALHLHGGGEPAQAAGAMRRLKSEELLIHLHLMREQRRQAACAAPVLTPGALCEGLLRSFPFPLTDAQQGVWREISGDLSSGQRMHRLLQGDVGAGKTWIAALCMAAAVDQGCQAALLAPTEVLATQHAATLNELFAPLELEVGLLTGSTRAARRRAMLQKLAAGEMSMLVGTHALLTGDVVFHRLGVALVDEQHRFGVRQRWALTEKGEAVHLLGMTATPIPRSLALAVYGDMDLSVMRGMPPGRKPVETRVLPAARMQALAAGMRRILDQGGRIYWIVPRIDEDEDGVSVDQRADLLRRHFPDAGVCALHGRMKAGEKQQTLDAFAGGSCRILVSTTVVEVGVNVTSARLIVIEQAEQYGLAQLHQLRGRVGRSDEQGYCILVAGDGLSSAAMQRLKLMERSHDGLELAEADMQLRGAGDVIGTRQSGDAAFRLLDPVADAELIRSWHGHMPAITPDDAMQRFWRPHARSVD